MTKIPDGARLIAADSPEGKRVGRVYDIARHIRGSFMEQTILIDVIIAGVLTSYFTPDEEERKVLGGEVLGGRGLAETSLYSRRS